MKEKKPALTEALIQTLQAMHKSGCINLTDIVEGTIYTYSNSELQILFYLNYLRDSCKPLNHTLPLLRLLVMYVHDLVLQALVLLIFFAFFSFFLSYSCFTSPLASVCGFPFLRTSIETHLCKFNMFSLIVTSKMSYNSLCGCNGTLAKSILLELPISS